VVVCSGLIVTDPARLTAPIPLSMCALCACSDVQVSSDDPPWAIVAGDALKLTVGGWFTVIVALAVAVPPAFAAVMV